MLCAIIALILSLIAPGSGQIFNGQYGKGLAFAFIFVFGRYVLLPLAVRIFNFRDDVKNLKLIYAFNIIYPVLILISAVDAAYHAPRVSHSGLGAVYAVLAMVMISAMYRAVGTRLIVYCMCGREDMLQYILPRKKPSPTPENKEQK